MARFNRRLTMMANDTTNDMTRGNGRRLECETVALLLYRFADGLLLADDQDSVSEHVSACPACRARLEAIVDLDAVAAEVEDESPSPRLRARLLEDYRARFALIRPAAGFDPAPTRRPAVHRVFRAAASIALVVTVGLGAFVAGRGSHEGPEVVKPSPAASLDDVFPLRLAQNYTTIDPDGRVRLSSVV
jgi:anti-sigma factor RsiW